VRIAAFARANGTAPGDPDMGTIIEPVRIKSVEPLRRFLWGWAADGVDGVESNRVQLPLADAMPLSGSPPGAIFDSFDRSFVRRANRAGLAGVSLAAAKE
jgi:hypothetical protein